MSAIGHVKIALTTNNLTHVDTSFTSARQIVFYDVTYDQREFLEMVRFAKPRPANAADTAPPAESATPRPGAGRNGGCCFADAGLTEGSDRLAGRVEAMQGCAILFCKELNDLAAVRLRDVGVFPVKLEQRCEIDIAIDALQNTMNARPPLWLRKALGYGVCNPEFQLVHST